MKEWCGGLNDLPKISGEIVASLPDNGIIILRGDLAAGKTTLVKAIASYLGVENSVSSPTFSLQNCYDEALFHYDIYNQGLEQFMSLGLFEEFEKSGRHFVEWGDAALERLLDEAGFEVKVIEIEKDRQTRCYRIRNA